MMEITIILNEKGEKTKYNQIDVQIERKSRQIHSAIIGRANGGEWMKTCAILVLRKKDG